MIQGYINKIITQGQKKICHIPTAPGMDTYVPMWQPHGASLVRNSVDTCCEARRFVRFVGGCGATKHSISRPSRPLGDPRQGQSFQAGWVNSCRSCGKGGVWTLFWMDRLQSQVTDSCKQYGGFYLGSVGGAAAVLAEDCIKKVEAPPPCGDKLNDGNRLIQDLWAVLCGSKEHL